MKLVRIQSRSGGCDEEKYIFPLPGIKLRFLGRPARSVVTIPTELSHPPIIIIMVTD
jgi:hypothetical protein